MPQLRPYQQDLFDRIFQSYRDGSKATVAVLPTGGGKTVVIAEVLKAFNAPAVAIAHRKELVSQLSVALARNGVRHRVIGDSKLMRRIAGLHIKIVGRDYTNRNSPIAVAGIDTLINMDERDPWFSSVKFFCIDECFVAGTLIDGKPIEQIQVGDWVSAFNELAGQIERRKVTRVFKNVAPKHMVRVKVGHHVLDCTMGHPFYTKRGWVEAVNLTTQDEVLLYGNQMSRMRECCGLIETPPCSVEKDGACVLQQDVYVEIPLEGIERNDGAHEQEIRLGSHEEKEPDAQSRDAEESISDAQSERSSTENSGRQRATSDQARSDIDDSIRGLGVRSSIRNQNQDAEGFGLSDVLQAGRGESETDAGVRSGRRESLRQATHRREEGQFLTWTRLDSVEVYERPDRTRNGDGGSNSHVYNLEVEGLHTYIANGVVVHNCHHVLRDNKWGRGAAMFPNAIGLLPTATPCRADRKGLGRHADGIADAMVVGPTMRELINQGYLCDYRVFVPPSDVDYSDVTLTESGDLSLPKLRAAVHRSTRIVGDVVQHYKRIAPGKLGVTFAVDVEAATEMAEAFRQAGVPAEVLTGLTPDELRADILRRFERREILQITSVDILGEGFDLPAIEVISMVRKTESFSLYAQQFGRVLRPLEGKKHAIIIDHVGNFIRHGPPDARTDWTLDAGEKRRSKSLDAESVRACDNPTCLAAYPRRLTHCPYCEQAPTVTGRSAPEQVDGDLHELDPAFLAHLRGEIDRIDGAATIPMHLDRKIQIAVFNRHAEKQEAQKLLRSTMSLWAGYWTARGETIRVAQKRFFLTWGVDVMTAQTLGVKDATALRERILTWMQDNNVRGAE